jgi:heme/copper-type cytochrome/quinol oxidase subunit 2
MKMMVVVLPEAEYTAWMNGKKKQTFRDAYFAAAAATTAPAEGAAPADSLAVKVDTLNVAAK